MSRNNRLYDFAFRGCLTAGLLWAGLAYAQEGTNPALENQPVPESGQHTSKGGAADQGQQTEPAPEKISPALNQIEAAIRDLIAQERAAQGQGPKDEEIRDLKAQEGMAHWAEFMFWATVAAVVLTFAGIFLIWRTLHHTRRAADYTKGMLDEAKKTTEAAQASVKETKKSAERQLRAYVHLFGPTITFEEDGTVEINIRVQNAGQTPAHQLTWWIKTGIAAFDLESNFRSDSPAAAEVSSFVLQPGGSADRPIKVTKLDTANKRESVANSKDAIFVFGNIKYRDVFDQPHTTRVQLMYSGALEGKKRLSTCQKGNEAD